MHSPEPWAPFGRQVIDANQHIIVQCANETNPSRIVACVNACQGIPTDRLAKMDLKAALEHLDNGHGNIDCDGYCPVAKALYQPKEEP